MYKLNKLDLGVILLSVLFGFFSFSEIAVVKRYGDEDPIIGTWRIASIGTKLVDDSMEEVRNFDECFQKNFVTYFENGSLRWNIHKTKNNDVCEFLGDNYLIGNWNNISWANYEVNYLSENKELEERYNTKSLDKYYWSSSIDTMKIVKFYNQNNQKLKPKDITVESTIYVKVKK